MMQAVSKVMAHKKIKNGAIVNVSSISGKVGSLRTGFFKENSENGLSSPKMVESKNQSYHQKVLLKTFPMNSQ
jgi:NAD(P)-dependent dehydrogenase (short-subunit alcohol dehydrogenase family)